MPTISKYGYEGTSQGYWVKTHTGDNRHDARAKDKLRRMSVIGNDMRPREWLREAHKAEETPAV